MAWSVNLVSRKRIATGAEDWYEIVKDGVVQPVVDPQTSTPVAGFIVVAFGRNTQGSPFSGIKSVPAAVAPPDDIQSAVWDFAQLSAPIGSATSIEAEVGITENGVQVAQYRLRAFEDAGSPAGYGWSLSTF